MARRKKDDQDPRFQYDAGGRQIGLNWEAIKRQQTKRGIVEERVIRSKPKKSLSRPTNAKATAKRIPRRSAKK